MGSTFPASLGKSRRLGAFNWVANSDCVVECVIKSIHIETTTLHQYEGVGDDREIDMFVAELSDVVVHRGFGSPREVAMDFELGPRRWVGQHVLLCCDWNPRLRMFGVGRQRLFHRLYGRWAETEREMGIPPEQRASFADSELDSVVDANSLSSLSRAADVIVVGRVASVKDSSSTEGPSGHRFVTMDVNRVLKGDGGLGSVAFLRNWDSPYLEADQTWIAFLRRDGDGYHPLGGCNGLLRFDRQAVYFGRYVRCPFPRNALVERVRRLVAMDRYQRRRAGRK